MCLDPGWVRWTDNFLLEPERFWKSKGEQRNLLKFYNFWNMLWPTDLLKYLYVYLYTDYLNIKKSFFLISWNPFKSYHYKQDFFCALFITFHLLTLNHEYFHAIFNNTILLPVCSDGVNEIHAILLPISPFCSHPFSGLPWRFSPLRFYHSKQFGVILTFYFYGHNMSILECWSAFWTCKALYRYLLDVLLTTVLKGKLSL